MSLCLLCIDRSCQQASGCGPLQSSRRGLVAHALCTVGKKINCFGLHPYCGPLNLLMIPLIMSVLYVWAQLNRDMIVSFWFGTRFKACYLPWVILGFNYIIGGSVINELIGNLVGHLYFFLMFRYPMDLGGRNFLSTPQFLYRWLPSRRGGVSGFGVPPASMRRAADQNGGGGRHNWGQGFRLGDQIWDPLSSRVIKPGRNDHCDAPPSLQTVGSGPRGIRLHVARMHRLHCGRPVRAVISARRWLEVAVHQVVWKDQCTTTQGPCDHHPVAASVFVLLKRLESTL
ncbi:hypothetical protein CB1_000444035 [Camelus ferus]|nr:hypothetical protein CB1_000444035 [Camelus ferus]